ncbi:YifB family Mg chelatase-like AAA ATPase [Metabacillus litoralis]|uniref:YifB family Mg chelatase-like AAA ATPase n=1 Tax=Metabacillus TaxID=2675233 RepID=UPI001B992155|nr:YifB family Mg chelatase-like AAA ATPase [Metabacillus litoralis]UHA61452.1 YifB family Mg chelatase-like AAA ATPase [Metabacillus litoralis]
MTVKISSVGLRGLEGYRVQVEVQVRPGVESMVIVGLPDASVKKSKERVLSSIRAIVNSGTAEKVVVNLSPSEQRKNGPLFDLPIALGLLKEKNYIKEQIPHDTMFIGALSLDGMVERVEGMLPALIAAKKLGYKKVFLPYDPRVPIDMLNGIECVVVQHVHDVVKLLSGEAPTPLPSVTSFPKQEPSFNDHQKDFSHIIGHQFSKEALEIAAAGGHNVLMSGPPGCGKSVLAETFPSILPPLSKSAQLEVISLYQLANERMHDPQMAPFRNPHHSASSIAIIGGGSYSKPGEISLAHHGVLFLDEMAEFTKKTIDMLRQPLETGKGTISRVHSTVIYPTSFILIGAMNPCPCGYLGSASHYCTCTQKQIKAYRNRVSGPVYDRMDILLSLNSVNLNQATGKQEKSSEMRGRVEKARKKQFTRYQEQVTNAKVPYDLFIKTSPLTDKQQKIIMQEATKNLWSNRVQIKIFRLARTIADLAGERQITDESVWKAIQLRRAVFRELR